MLEIYQCGGLSFYLLAWYFPLTAYLCPDIAYFI